LQPKYDISLEVIVYLPNIALLDDGIYAFRAQTFGIFNRRFAIFVKDCTPDMFVLAYLLDPSKLL
jgi:hypothetical protein